MAAHENNICIETSELDLEEASIAQEEADIYTPLLHEHQQSHKHTNDITHRIIIHRMTVVTVASIIISVLLLYAYVTSIPDGANNNNLFSYYLVNFASYNKVYGSIGSLIALMVWLYFIALILLVGFEINASIDQVKEEKEDAETDYFFE